MGNRVLGGASLGIALWVTACSLSVEGLQPDDDGGSRPEVGGLDAPAAPLDASEPAPSDASGTDEREPPSDGGVDGQPDPLPEAGADSGGPSACGSRLCSGPCTMHSNGLGQTFSDCKPLQTYSQAQAVEACTASSRGSCTSLMSACGDAQAEGAVCVCPSTFPLGTESCWVYSGPHAGLVFSSTAIGCSACPPPLGGARFWN